MSSQHMVDQNPVTLQIQKPFPRIYYQNCIREECEMWDETRSTCGLKHHERGK
jgi:hypothetical protein